MRAWAFFLPRLAPVLERRTRHTDARVAPQVPPRRAGGHAILHDEPPRQSDDAMGLLTPGWRHIRPVSLDVLLTLRTRRLCIRDDEIPRTPQGARPHVVQRPLALLVPLGLVPTPRTGWSRGGATGRDDLWRGPVGHGGQPCGGIGSLRPRTDHGWVLRDQMLGPALYDRCPSGAIPKPGQDAIVSANRRKHKRCSSTLSVGKDLHFFPQLDRLPAVRCFLYACYGNPRLFLWTTSQRTRV
jgi:hypothetical protein